MLDVQTQMQTWTLLHAQSPQPGALYLSADQRVHLMRIYARMAVLEELQRK